MLDSEQPQPPAEDEAPTTTIGEVRVVLTSNGRINLEYPQNNKILAYGLLGAALEMMINSAGQHQTVTAGSRNIVVPGMLMPRFQR